MEMVGRKLVGLTRHAPVPLSRVEAGARMGCLHSLIGCFPPISLEVIQKTLIFVGVNRFCRTPWKA